MSSASTAVCERESKTCNFVVVVVVVVFFSFLFSFAFARMIDKNPNTPIFSPMTDDFIPRNGVRSLRFLIFKCEINSLIIVTNMSLNKRRCIYNV